MTNQPGILLVEDDEDAAFLIRKLLAKAELDAPVRHALDGEQAMALLNAEARFSLVILDLNLPKRDGFEVLAHIRQQECTRALPTVIMSTSSDDRHRARALALGANDYLQKFPQPEVFRQTVDRLLGSR